MRSDLYHQSSLTANTSCELALIASSAYGIGRGLYKGAQYGIQSLPKAFPKTPKMLAQNTKTGAENINAGISLTTKLRQLETMQQTAAKTRILPDGRIRYYKAERMATYPGHTRGSSYVTEYNPNTEQVRGWNECYDQLGNVNRVHPKDINGQSLTSQHYPLIAQEIIP